MTTACIAATEDRVDAPRSFGVGTMPVIGGALAFLVLTLAVFWHQLARIQADDASPRWAELRWGYLVLLMLCIPLETLAATCRTRVVAGVLHPGLGFWTCLRAEWVNVAMNLLTPAHLGGGPGQIYIMGRAGVRAGTALTISLLGFLGTMVGLMAMGLYTLLATSAHPGGPLFAGSVGCLAAVAGSMLAAGLWPHGFRAGLGWLSRGLWRLAGRRVRLEPWWPPGDPSTGPAVDQLPHSAATLADIVYTYQADVRRFLRVGKLRFVAVCLLSLAFLFSRCLLPYLCLRFLGIEGSSFADTLERQTGLVFLVFFAPTPGGAGVAEAVSLAAMGDVVRAGFAPYYNLLWRFATAYLPALAGLVCLAVALAQDAHRALRRRGPDLVGWCPPSEDRSALRPVGDLAHVADEVGQVLVAQHLPDGRGLARVEPVVVEVAQRSVPTLSATGASSRRRCVWRSSGVSVSRYASAAAVTIRHTAHISPSGGVLAGLPEPTCSSSPGATSRCCAHRTQ